MGKTFKSLGLLASVMALSSLAYGAFHEPLAPFMQGVMGGVMEVYRTMRDVLFSGLGWTFSGLTNFVGHWFESLPPAPWIHVQSWAKDLMTLWGLGAGIMTRAEILISKENSEFHDSPNPAQSSLSVGSYQKQRHVIWYFVANLLKWPFTVLELFNWWLNTRRQIKYATENSTVRNIEDPNRAEYIRYDQDMVLAWTGKALSIIAFSALTTVVGTLTFFIFVYAENRIGL